MPGEIVIVTGAGFSAPANLPIQDKILQEMMEPPEDNFINSAVGKESKKFLEAYIQVTMYLLREYTSINVDDLIDFYGKMEFRYHSNERVLETLEYIRENFHSKAEEKDFNLIDALDSAREKCYFKPEDYYLELISLKEKLRENLKAANLQICLEDIFTLFDKCITTKENTADYTYVEIDRLQHELLRLFTYYFSNRVNSHNYDNSDYMKAINFIRKHAEHISIVTTNWDILLEEYFRRNDISYDYSFHSSYVMGTDGWINPDKYNDRMRKIPYIKIHGSINWFRCLRCGTLHVYEAEMCGKYLFDDNEKEKCAKCGQVGQGKTVQVKPEIITPTMMKLITSQLYNNLWQNAAYALQRADRIVFCGYSLPLADYEFRYLLKQNIRAKTDIDVVLYHNDDPSRYKDKSVTDFLPQKRYTDLFPNNTKRFYYEGFGKYFYEESIKRQ